MNNLYLNIDCFKLFKKIKEQKIEVNLILTDPPYNISRKNNFKTIGRNGIDFGKWDWNFDQTKWIKEIYEKIYWDELKKIRCLEILKEGMSQILNI